MKKILRLTLIAKVALGALLLAGNYGWNWGTTGRFLEIGRAHV